MGSRSGRSSGRSIAGAVVPAVGLVLLLVAPARAAISWGPQHEIPRGFSWNYGNALDFTGVPGRPRFRLHDAFVSDATIPEGAFYTRSTDGGSWTTPKRLSGGDVNAEGATIATAGRRVIVGWMTGFSVYDPAGAHRRMQIDVSTDRGSTWEGVKSLSPRAGAIDYPVVAAAKTTFGPVNLYAVWIDAETGKLMFRERSAAHPWSAAIVLGATRLHRSTGYTGFANIAAVGDLITVAWIADATGTLRARTIDLADAADPRAAATAANWGPRVRMSENVSLAQHGYPIVSASPLVPGVITVAWNTVTSQVYTTSDGSTIGSTPMTIWDDDSPYTGGYATAVEPAPGGFVAMWAGCRDTPLVHDCNDRKAAARIDLLSSTSTDGTTFTIPTVVASAAVKMQRINDAPSIVATADHVYAQYDGYTASRSSYDVFDRVATGVP